MQPAVRNLNLTPEMFKIQSVEKHRNIPKQMLC
jgi:hypothetical protein